MCIFCDIAARRIEAHIVAEDDLIVAFLDICPIRPGHTQIIPKRHVPYFEELDADTANRMLALGQRLSTIMKALYGVERVAFLFTGGDVAHAHAHVVPMLEKTDITSRLYIAEPELTFGSTPQASAEELMTEAAALRSHLAALRLP